MNSRNQRGVTQNFVSAALVKGTNKSYTTTVTTAGVINGKFVTTLGAQTNAAVPTTDANTGAAFVAQTDNTACAYVFGITAAGAIAVCQGPVEATETGSGTTAGAFKNRPQFPVLPDNFCPIGYLFVRTAPDASDFTFGTSSWTATGITASAVVEVDGSLPDRPQALP